MQDPAQQQDVGTAIEAESLDVCVPFPFTSYGLAFSKHI
jgi:hypothetical protein